MTAASSRTVVVTGGAGALGRAVVDLLRRQDAQVVVLDLPGAHLDDIGSADGVHAIAVDLTDAASVDEAWNQVDDLGIPSALVALAGAFRPGPLSEIDQAGWDEMWHGNVSSLLWSAKAAATRIQPGGAIVTVGSKTAITGAAPLAHATSKAAVVRITELLADELRPRHIRVNAVLPSVIDTPSNRSWMSPDLAERAVAPDAIAKVIAFLLSPDAAPINGAAIPVFGDA